MVKYFILPKTKRRYLVSGPNASQKNIFTVSTYNMGTDTEDITKLLKRLIKQLSGKVEQSDGDLTPEYRIIGHGHIWCWAPSSRKMVKITRNTAAYVIEHNASEDGKVMIYTAFGDVVLIDPNEIELIGFD